MLVVRTLCEPFRPVTNQLARGSGLLGAFCHLLATFPRPLGRSRSHFDPTSSPKDTSGNQCPEDILIFLFLGSKLDYDMLVVPFLEILHTPHKGKANHEREHF
jgi:hypothetical protein